MDKIPAWPQNTCERCGEPFVPGYHECWKCAGEGEQDPAAPVEGPRSEEGFPVKVSIPASVLGNAPIEKKLGLWIELGVVLTLAWLPSFALALWALLNPRETHLTFLQSRIILLFEQSAQIGLVLYVVWKSGRGLGHFGLGRPMWRLDGLATLFLTVMIAGLYALLWRFLARMFPGQHRPGTYEPVGAAQHSLAVFSMLVSGLAQELLMRGYLITRLETLFKSTTAAVFLSSLLFAAYHIYQGAAGTLVSLAFGLMFGCAYAGIRRVWPLALAHALWILCIIYNP